MGLAMEPKLTEKGSAVPRPRTRLPLSAFEATMQIVMAGRIDITIKNYRRFPEYSPARLRLGGFTALVGVNNAGKSSMLRFFYEFRDLFRRIASGEFLNLFSGVNFNYAGLSDNAEVFSNSNDRSIEIEIYVPDLAPDSQIPNLRRLRLTIQRGTNRAIGIPIDPVMPDAASSARAFRDTRMALLNPSDHSEVRQVVDTAEMQDALDALSRTVYLPAFRNAINVGATGDYYDVPTGTAFVTQWRTLKTETSQRAANEAIVRLTQDIRGLFKFNELEINASNDGQTLQVFIDGKSYRLVELGSGLAQFILALATVATKRPRFVLLDEPELNLHPSLQLDFLTTIASYASDGLVFATHTLGLARASADRVYIVRAEGPGQSRVSEMADTPRLAEALGELSFFGYREVGYDKVLLVEGPKDVTAAQQLLRACGKSQSAVILPLGGNSMINAGAEEQLLEVTRISDNVLVLLDSERDRPHAPIPQDRQAFAELCARIGINCHILERRAIENYFTTSAVQKVMGEKYSALQPYEVLKDATPAWAKRDNWRIAREMTRGELEPTDLGVVPTQVVDSR